MPKIPKNKRKIRVGSSAWAEQRERDIAYARQQQQQQQQKEPNSSKKNKQTEEEHTWWKQKEEKEKQDEERKERKERREKKKEFQEFQDPIRKIYLEILGLTRLQDDATSIKTAYRHLALQFHPDKNKSADAESKMKAFNEAYEFLTK
jgi:hypothetical protein